MQKRGERQAFPHEERIDQRVQDPSGYRRTVTVNVPRPGMTLLEHYAGVALGALLAAPGREGSEARRNPDAAGEWAREHAEALLAALDRPDDPVERLRFDLRRLAKDGLIDERNVETIIEAVLEGDGIPHPSDAIEAELAAGEAP